MKGIKETIEEIKNVIVKLRAEAIDHTDDWKKYPHKRSLKDINERIEKLWKDFSELETEWEKKDLEISNRNNWIDPTDLEKEATKRGMVSAEDYKKVLENQRPENLPSDWAQQIADKDKYLQERDERPNITVENYNSLLSNQKPADYESVKEELEKLKSILEGRNLEQVQTDLNRISELERKSTLEQPKEATEGENTIEKLLKEILEKLTKESSQQQQLIIDLPKELQKILTSEKSESPISETEAENEAKRRIQTELDKFKSINLGKINDEECFNLLNKFKQMKNWIFTGNEGESAAAISKQSELKEITNRLSLEAHKRKWKQKIDYALKDEYEYEEEEEKIVLKKTDLTKVEYIDYEITLSKKANKKEVDDFGNEVMIDIYKQRPKHKYIMMVLDEGKEAIENKSIDWVNEVLADLKFLERTEKQAYRSKIVEINRLKQGINSLIQSQQQQAQIVRNDK